MSGSHGCAGRTGRLGLGIALAASGLFVASGPSPVLASPVHHEGHHAWKHDWSSTSAAPTSGGSDTTPTGTFHHWHRTDSAATPPAVIPTAATATPPAAQTLAPSTPTVANQGMSQPCGAPPPPPCSTMTSTSTSTSTAPASSGTSQATPAASQTLSPAASSLNATPAPEPSTVLSALAMIGAVAWRRRAARPRG